MFSIIRSLSLIACILFSYGAVFAVDGTLSGSDTAVNESGWVNDTDRDGIIDTRDSCILVYAETPSGCPSIDTYSRDKNTSLTQSTWDTAGVENNICLTTKQKEQWLLIGIPNCTQCPCANSIEISSLLRSCDIVFPTILSPLRDTIYSRGWFYLIP